jgi:hypothetical protein
VSVLHGVAVGITDLGGTALGLASGNSVWLDDNAVGWGWFVGSTPQSDSEFARRGNQGERNRMELLTVLEHEVGHLLGYEHGPGGVLQEILGAGTQRTTGPTIGTDGLGAAPTSIAGSGRSSRTYWRSR